MKICKCGKEIRCSEYKQFILDRYNFTCHDGRVMTTTKVGIPVTQLLFGDPPSSQTWDHKDRDIHNNTDENIRPATRSQNNSNRSLQKNNSSGYPGVYLHTRGRYQYIIEFHGKRYVKGGFETIEECVVARNKRAKQIQGDFAVISPIPGATDTLADSNVRPTREES